MKLVLASNNAHKVKEILQILGEGYEVLTPSELGVLEDIPETGNSFAANAMQKAEYLAQRTLFAVIADDSGLEVDALNGEPGVYSARYAGLQRSHEDNIDLLLRNLEGNENRGAQFRTVIALLLEGKEYYFEGLVRGYITTKRLGNNGFGYDPVFIPEGHSRSFAEMSEEKKNSMSHRGRAMQKLLDFLKGK